MVNGKQETKQAINKIIFFLESPLEKRDYERFGVQLLEQNHFNVQIWDLTPLLFPRVHQEFDQNNRYYPVELRIFTGIKDVLSEIKNLTHDTIVVSMIKYRLNSYKYFKAISNRNISYCIFMGNTHPVSGLKWNYGPKKINPLKILNYLFLKIPQGNIGIKEPTYILAGGYKSISGFRVLPGTEVLWIHSLDYDIYLEEKRKKHKEEDYILFLDEDVPFHSDYLYFNKEPYSCAEEYYPALCRFFSYLENKYGLEVIIAAHPRSNYEKRTDYYQGRKLIRGKTAELVKKSKYVVTHCSTSISYAVLFRKPLVFITTNELKHSIQGPWIDYTAGLFAKTSFNIDKEYRVNLNSELFIDEDRYRIYLKDYIKYKGEESFFWQVFSNKLRDIKS